MVPQGGIYLCMLNQLPEDLAFNQPEQVLTEITPFGTLTGLGTSSTTGTNQE